MPDSEPIKIGPSTSGFSLPHTFSWGKTYIGWNQSLNTPMQRILPFSAFIWLSALVLILFFSQCKSPANDPNASSASITSDSTPSVTEPNPEEGGDTLDGEPGNRGLGGEVARIMDFSFKDYFPTLYPLVEADEATLTATNAYAEQVVTRQGIETEADLKALFEKRESDILPFLQTRIEQLDDQQFYDLWKPLEAELNQIGLTALTAEAMFTGLGIAPVLESEVLRLGSPAFQAYMEFRYAEAVAGSGEYPFSNLKSYQEMVLAGEALRELDEGAYYAEIEESLEWALHTMTDIHLVSSRSARESAPSPMSGGVNTDFYPFLTETESLEAFATKHPDEPVGQVAARLMENMSQMTDEPENLYLIVTEWKEEKEQANARIIQHLRAGEDIPHLLRIRQGDGKDRYAITYRFYEDADQADSALSKILPDFPAAEMVFVSVKGDQLYQLGPAN